MTADHCPVAESAATLGRVITGSIVSQAVCVATPGHNPGYAERTHRHALPNSMTWLGRRSI